MKSIQLKTTAVTNSSLPAGIELSYKKEYLNMLEIAPEGITIGEMGDLIKVIDKLRAADDTGTITLENSEWSALKARVENAKFSFVAQELVDMVSAVTNAADV